MRRSRFAESQVVAILETARAGGKVAELCRRHGISPETFRRWRSKYSGLDAAEAERLRRIDGENRQLKRALADVTLENQMLRDVVSRKW